MQDNTNLDVIAGFGLLDAPKDIDLKQFALDFITRLSIDDAVSQPRPDSVGNIEKLFIQSKKPHRMKLFSDYNDEPTYGLNASFYLSSEKRDSIKGDAVFYIRLKPITASALSMMLSNKGLTIATSAIAAVIIDDQEYTPASLKKELESAKQLAQNNKRLEEEKERIEGEKEELAALISALQENCIVEHQLRPGIRLEQKEGWDELNETLGNQSKGSIRNLLTNFIQHAETLFHKFPVSSKQLFEHLNIIQTIEQSLIQLKTDLGVNNYSVNQQEYEMCADFFDPATKPNLMAEQQAIINAAVKYQRSLDKGVVVPPNKKDDLSSNTAGKLPTNNSSANTSASTSGKKTESKDDLSSDNAGKLAATSSSTNVSASTSGKKTESTESDEFDLTENDLDEDSNEVPMSGWHSFLDPYTQIPHPLPDDLKATAFKYALTSQLPHSEDPTYLSFLAMLNDINQPNNLTVKHLKDLRNIIDTNDTVLGLVLTGEIIQNKGGAEKLREKFQPLIFDVLKAFHEAREYTTQNIGWSDKRIVKMWMNLNKLNTQYPLNVYARGIPFYHQLYYLPKLLEETLKIIDQTKRTSVNGRQIFLNALFWLAMLVTVVGLVAYSAYQLHHRHKTGHWHFFYGKSNPLQDKLQTMHDDLSNKLMPQL